MFLLEQPETVVDREGAEHRGELVGVGEIELHAESTLPSTNSEFDL